MLIDPVQTPISLDNVHIVSYISAKCVTYNCVIVYIYVIEAYRGLDRVRSWIIDDVDVIVIGCMMYGTWRGLMSYQGMHRSL